MMDISSIAAWAASTIGPLLASSIKQVADDTLMTAVDAIRKAWLGKGDDKQLLDSLGRGESVSTPQLESTLYTLIESDLELARTVIAAMEQDKGMRQGSLVGSLEVKDGKVSIVGSIESGGGPITFII